MDKRILITGISGFIGRYLAKILIERGYEVHGLIHNTYLPETKGLYQYKINLGNYEEINNFLELNKFENLIHLAWYVGKSCHTHDNNIDCSISTLNLAKAFVENNGKIFLGAGSVSEYEYKYGYFLEDETPTDSKTLYGNCKNAIYNILKVYLKQHNCSFKWLRIFNLYGENEKPQRLMSAVINSCLKNEDVKVSDCLKFQDYLYLPDTVDGIIKVFESDFEGAINISSGKPVQLHYIVETIAKLTNFKGRILYGAIPAAFGDEVIVGNNDKLKSLGWKQRFSLEDGLKEIIEWWKQNNKEA